MRSRTLKRTRYYCMSPFFKYLRTSSHIIFQFWQSKETEFKSQTLILSSIYLCNLMSQTVDILNYEFLNHFAAKDRIRLENLRKNLVPSELYKGTTTKTTFQIMILFLTIFFLNISLQQNKKKAANLQILLVYNLHVHVDPSCLITWQTSKV